MVDKRTLEKYEKEAKEKNRESWFVVLFSAFASRGTEKKKCSELRFSGQEDGHKLCGQPLRFLFRKGWPCTTKTFRLYECMNTAAKMQCEISRSFLLVEPEEDKKKPH